MMGDMRPALNASGASLKVMVMAVDGSFCNRTVFGTSVDRTEIVARIRKDAVLCFAAPAGSHRFYNTQKFTPETVLRNESIPWNVTKVFYGGKRRRVRYKVVSKNLLRNASRRLPPREKCRNSRDGSPEPSGCDPLRTGLDTRAQRESTFLCGRLSRAVRPYGPHIFMRHGVRHSRVPGCPENRGAGFARTPDQQQFLN